MYANIEKLVQWFSYLSKSGSRGHLIWEKQLADIQKLGKPDWRNLIVYFTLKPFKSMENYALEQLKYFEFCFHKYSSKPTTNLNVISCNFIIVGAIFMKFSPKCNKNSDIGKFVIKFGNFCLYFQMHKSIFWVPNFIKAEKYNKGHESTREQQIVACFNFKGSISSTSSFVFIWSDCFCPYPLGRNIKEETESKKLSLAIKKGFENASQGGKYCTKVFNRYTIGNVYLSSTRQIASEVNLPVPDN